MKISGLAYWFAQVPLGKIITLLPLRVVNPLAMLAGKILFVRLKEGHDYTRKLRLLLPDVQSSVGKAFCRQRILRFCEELKLPAFLTEKSIRKLFDVEGIQHLDESFQEGRGVIMVGSHFGAFQPGLLHVACLGYKLHIMRALTDRALRVTSPLLYRQILKFRGKILKGTESMFIYYKPDRNYLELFSDLLRKNEAILILADAGSATRFADVPFFSGKLRLPTGFAYLAWKCKSPVVPFFCARKGLRYRLIIESPYRVEGESEAAITSAVGRFASLLEKYIKSYPDHWLLLPQYQLESTKESTTWCLYNPVKPARRFYDLEDFD